MSTKLIANSTMAAIVGLFVFTSQGLAAHHEEGEAAAPAIEEAAPAEEAAAAEETSAEAPALVQVEDAKLGVVYIAPDVDWSKYNKVMFVPMGIEYQRHGNTRMYRLRQSDKEKMGEEFVKAMTKHLTADGKYEIVTEPGPGTLIMGAGLNDVWLIFTKDAARSRGGVYGEYAIRMTLITEMYDAETMEVLVQAADRQGRRIHTHVRRITSVDAWQEVRRAFDLWASSFRTGLDRVHAGGGVEPAPEATE